MKSFFAFLLLFSINTYAAVLEVNSSESKVYYTVTPTLQLNLVDLGSDGGMLTVFLEYRGNDISQELKQLHVQYPNFQIQAVIARSANEYVDLEIPDLGLKKSLRVNQGQTGPYINSQFMLTAAQTKKLKNLQRSLKESVRLQIPVRASYSSGQVIESVTLDESACGGAKVTSVQDIIAHLGNMKRPESIKKDKTFSSLKQDILDKCYGINSTQINSFAELMKHPVNLEHPASLNGVTTEIVAQERFSVLSLNLELEVN
ncbi:MAG: hypothetical protein HUU57_04985 [Bdellovibrio sp.]|nr:hypothetical protein [Bdellovibrio sp.]